MTIKRFMINSAQQRIDILDATAELMGSDRHQIINRLVADWASCQVDPELKDKVLECFKDELQ